MYPDGVSKGFELVRKGGNAGVQMKGNEVYKVAVNTLGQLVTETLNANNISEVATRLADPAPGQSAHHRGDRAALGTADGARHRHDRATRATPPPPRCLSRSIRGFATAACERGQLLLLEAFGGGLHLGIGAHPLLSEPHGEHARARRAPCSVRHPQ